MSFVSDEERLDQAKRALREWVQWDNHVHGQVAMTKLIEAAQSMQGRLSKLDGRMVSPDAVPPCSPVAARDDTESRSARVVPRQDSLTDQLQSVVRMAEERGCYDAADWIRARTNEPTCSSTAPPPLGKVLCDVCQKPALDGWAGTVSSVDPCGCKVRVCAEHGVVAPGEMPIIDVLHAAVCPKRKGQP